MPEKPWLERPCPLRATGRDAFAPHVLGRSLSERGERRVVQARRGSARAPCSRRSARGSGPRARPRCPSAPPRSRPCRAARASRGRRCREDMRLPRHRRAAVAEHRLGRAAGSARARSRRRAPRAPSRTTPSTKSSPGLTPPPGVRQTPGAKCGLRISASRSPLKTKSVTSWRRAALYVISPSSAR